MKNFFTLTFFLILTFQVNAQVFNYSGSIPAAIPNTNSIIDFPITVTGLSPQIDMTFGLTEVCLSITHPQPSDLKISLTSPDGNNIVLSLHNGNGGSDFSGTCLKMNAAFTLLNNVAPFMGDFRPDQSLNFLNNGQDPNGTWTLSIIDEFPFYSGTLDNVSIGFGNNPTPDPLASPFICSTTNSSGCVCKNTATTDCDLLPDLVCSYIIVRNGAYESVGNVDFPNAVINIGSGPVEMKPTGSCYCDTTPVVCTTILCPNGNPPKEQINQRIYHKNNGVMTYYDRPAGFQSYHPSHNHVHVQDFTQFSLRIKTANPDPRQWPFITQSVKQGYCLINMGDCDSQDSVCMSNGQVITNSMIPNYNLGTVTGCGPQGQGIFVGRFDLYGSGSGQEIIAPGICNGDYYIVAVIDPFNNFLEEDETNNVIAVPVHLTQQQNGFLNAWFTYQTSGLSAIFINNTTNVSRTWDFGDGVLSDDPYPMHQYAQPGIYTVKLTVYNNSCAMFTTQNVTVGTVGLQQHKTGLSDINLMPNPSKDRFTLEYQLANPSTITVNIVNLLGEKIKQFKEDALPGKHSMQLIDLQKGTYFITVRSDDSFVVKRAVKL